MGEIEVVDIVSPVEDLWAVIALICFGMMLGFVAGLGYSYFDILNVKNDAPKANIVGNVRIYPGENGPVEFSGVTILDADVGLVIDYCLEEDDDDATR